MVNFAQPGILAPLPQVGRYLFFSLRQPHCGQREALVRLMPLVDGLAVVVGFGQSCVSALGHTVTGLREFPAMSLSEPEIPCTPMVLWCWLRGDEQADLVHVSHRIARALTPAFDLVWVIDGFRYGAGPKGHGRDRTGYEDGTENPQDEAATTAAVVLSQGDGIDGSRFLAVQQWVHDFNAFESLSTDAQAGLMFVAFGCTFDAYEAQLRRMVGL